VVSTGPFLDLKELGSHIRAEERTKARSTNRPGMHLTGAQVHWALGQAAASRPDPKTGDHPLLADFWLYQGPSTGRNLTLGPKTLDGLIFIHRRLDEKKVDRNAAGNQSNPNKSTFRLLHDGAQDETHCRRTEQ
jgi:hypothetical protein